MKSRTRTSIWWAVFMMIFMAATSASAVTLQLGDGAGTVGDTIIIPVNLADVSGPIWSVELDFSWYGPYLTFMSVQTSGTMTEPWLAEFQSQSGAGHVALAGGTPLVSGGLLCYLEFRLDGGNGNIAINLDNGVINEDSDEVDLFDATINITALAVVDVFPDSGEMVVGSNMEFSTFGGLAPYTYTSSDPAVADFIGGDHILRGLSPGTVQVFTEDSNGVTDGTNGFITVRPFSLQALDTMGTEGQPVLVPMLLMDPTSYNIVSAEINLSWYAPYGDFNRVVTAGSLMAAAGWSTPAISSGPGTLGLAMAGATPLPGPGILCFLEFTFTNNLNLNVEPGLFNEIYQSLPSDGYITISALPNLTLTPYTTNLLVGDFLQLDLAGSPTSPVDYLVSEPGVIQINGDGLATALTAGGTDVWVVDSLGAQSNTIHIEVYDLALPALTMAIHADETVSIPVKVSTRLEDLDIYSLELGVNFSPYYVEFLGVTTTGSATEDWGQAVAVNDGNQVRAFHAGATHLQGCPSGLVYLDFLGLPTIGSVYSGVALESALFNEGSPRILLNAGTPCVASPVDLVPEAGLRLLPNHPNPFNPGTTIGYEVGDRGGMARLCVYSSRGQLVRRLLDETVRAGSMGQVYWDGRDEKGHRQPSGVYFAKLVVANQKVLQKMVLIK